MHAPNDIWVQQQDQLLSYINMIGQHTSSELDLGQQHYLGRQPTLLQKRQLSFRHSHWTQLQQKLPLQQSCHHHLQSQTILTLGNILLSCLLVHDDIILLLPRDSQSMILLAGAMQGRC